MPISSMELEVQRLLQHIDRNQARRFLTNPEPPTGFGDFPDMRDDALARVQREARKAPPFSAERFDAELARLLEMEKRNG